MAECFWVKFITLYCRFNRFNKDGGVKSKDTVLRRDLKSDNTLDGVPWLRLKIVSGKNNDLKEP